MSRLRKKSGKQFCSHITRKIKYIGKNLTKEVKALCNEKYKTQKKEIETTDDGKTSHVHGLVELILMALWYHNEIPSYY
jgi:hypothetical protein